MLYDFIALTKHFIESNTKIGIKHTAVAAHVIRNFNHKDGEIVRHDTQDQAIH